MLDRLQSRNALYAALRDFFSARDVLEVETPLMAPTTLPDPNVPSLTVAYAPEGALPKQWYLQTSPEFFMKRLLAQGSGSIFQIGKAFRNDHIGRHHRPEFSMLEWYRVGFDHHDLMDEMDALLMMVLGGEKALRITYTELFMQHVKLDPIQASVQDCLAVIAQEQIQLSEALQAADKDTFLNLILSHCIEPSLGFDRPCFIYDYPASQAALARLSEDSLTAHRFEVYVRGIELANGFYELNDSALQRERFEAYQAERVQQGLTRVPNDEAFLDCLDHLPDCAGVALGLDRLLMLKQDTNTIDDVLAF